MLPSRTLWKYSAELRVSPFITEPIGVFVASSPTPLWQPKNERLKNAAKTAATIFVDIFVMVQSKFVFEVYFSPTSILPL